MAALWSVVVVGFAVVAGALDHAIEAGSGDARELGGAGHVVARALEDARCGPLDLQVARERPVPVPGATVSTYDAVALAGVPTCAAGTPSMAIADPGVSTYVASVTPGGPADKPAGGMAQRSDVGQATGVPAGGGGGRAMLTCCRAAHFTGRQAGAPATATAYGDAI